MRIEFLQAGRGTEVDFERGVCVEDVRDGRAQLGDRGRPGLGHDGRDELPGAPRPVPRRQPRTRAGGGRRRARRADAQRHRGSGRRRRGRSPGPVATAVRSHAPADRPRRLPGCENRDAAGIRRADDVPRARGCGAPLRPALRSRVSTGSRPTRNRSTTTAGNQPRRLPHDECRPLAEKPYSIFMNREAFEAIEPEQRRAPHRCRTRRARAGTASDPARRGHRACRGLQARPALRRGGLLGRAQGAARGGAAGLRRTRGTRTRATRKLISEINDLREGFTRASALPRCVRSGSGAASGGTALEGRWRLTWTRKGRLIAVGIPAAIIPKDAPRSGTLIAEFEHGRYRGTVDGPVMTKGTYTVEGDVLNLVYEAPTLPGYVAGQVYRHRWNVFRDRLTFSRVSGSDADRVLLVKPLTRVG